LRVSPRFSPRAFCSVSYTKWILTPTSSTCTSNIQRDCALCHGYFGRGGQNTGTSSACRDSRLRTIGMSWIECPKCAGYRRLLVNSKTARVSHISKVARVRTDVKSDSRITSGFLSETR
jgi:hypothetical protein